MFRRKEKQRFVIVKANDSVNRTKDRYLTNFSRISLLHHRILSLLRSENICR